MTRKQKLNQFLKGVALLSAALFITKPSLAQEKEHSNSVGISLTTMRYQPGFQYVGAQLDYRYIHHRWIGVQIEGAVYPEDQAGSNVIGGYHIDQVSASGLIGHTWGKVGLYGEAGFGWFFPYILTSISGGYGHYQYNWRKLPTFVVGGILKIAVTKRWSLVYEVRDDLTFVGQYPAVYAPPTPQRQFNVAQGSFGISYSFH